MITADIGRFLTAEAREAIDREVLDIIERAVNACQSRDDLLLNLRAQNEGDSAPVKGPWKNSCPLEDSITREMHTTLLAALRQARRYPFYLIEACNPEDQQAAQEVEQIVNPVLKVSQYDRALDDVAYMCLESRWAPMFVGWHTAKESYYYEGFDEYANTPQQGMAEMNKAGLYFRVPDPWDVYTWPTTAASFRPTDPNGAEAVIERTYVTATDLIYAADELGYDKTAVLTLVKERGSQLAEGHQEVFDRFGISEDTNLIPIYTYIGRPPVVLDYKGDVLTPRELLYTDIVYVVSPVHRLILKRGLSPYPVRPYVNFVAYRVPNSLMGHGIVSMLSTIQDEMTAMLRLAIDNMNLLASAPFMVPESHLHRYGAVEFAPGKTIPVPNQGGIQQVQVNPAGAQLALSFQQYLYNRAAQIAAAQSVNSMLGGPVRKAAEVEFTANMLQTKFDLVVANFQYGMTDAAYAILATLGAFTGNGEIITGKPNPLLGLQVGELAQRMRVIPQVSSDNMNAQTRLQRDMTVMAALRQSPYYMAMLQAGTGMRGEYVLLRRLLEHMGYPDPETILGHPPTGTPSTDTTGGILGTVGQGPQTTAPETTPPGINGPPTMPAEEMEQV